MEHALQIFVGNGSILLLLIPVIGTLLTAGSLPLGIDTVRRTALTNALFSLAVSLLLVGHYSVSNVSRDGRVLQMSGGLSWTAQPSDPDESQTTTLKTPEIRISAAVDGISLWFVLAAEFVTFAAVCAHWGREGPRPGSGYVGLLLLQCATVGVCIAQDVVMILVSLLLATLPAFFLTGLWGDQGRHRAARGLALRQFAGSLAFAAGVGGILVTIAITSAMNNDGNPILTFHLPQIIHWLDNIPYTNPETIRYWGTLAPYCFLALFVGFCCVSPILAWPRDLLETAADGPLSAVAGHLILAPAAILVRLVLPIFSNAWSGLQIPLIVIATLFALMIAFGAQTRRHRHLLTGDALRIMLWFALIGFSRQSLSGIVGGLLLVITSALAAGLVPIAHRQPSGRFTKTVGILALASLAGSLAYLPGLAGFSGLVLVISETYALSAWLTLCHVVTVTLLVRAIILHYGSRESSPSTSAASSPVGWGAVPLVAALLVIGLVPQFLIDRMLPTIYQTIEVPVDDDTTEHATPNQRDEEESH